MDNNNFNDRAKGVQEVNANLLEKPLGDQPRFLSLNGTIRVVF